MESLWRGTWLKYISTLGPTSKYLGKDGLMNKTKDTTRDRFWTTNVEWTLARSCGLSDKSLPKAQFCARGHLTVS